MTKLVWKSWNFVFHWLPFKLRKNLLSKGPTNFRSIELGTFFLFRLRILGEYSKKLVIQWTIVTMFKCFFKRSILFGNHSKRLLRCSMKLLKFQSFKSFVILGVIVNFRNFALLYVRQSSMILIPVISSVPLLWSQQHFHLASSLSCIVSTLKNFLFTNDLFLELNLEKSQLGNLNCLLS